MRIQWKPLLISLALPLAVGGLSAFLTKNSMEAFAALNQPPLSPPGWVFPVAWTILYSLMGLACYLVYTAPGHKDKAQSALKLYGLQLAVNFIWPLLFFRFGLYGFAFFWLLLLWLLVYRTKREFAAISPLAGKLMLPYLLWLTFAAYLNLGVALLN